MNRHHEEALQKLDEASAVMRDATQAIKATAMLLAESATAVSRAHDLQHEAFRAIVEADADHEDLRTHVERLEQMVTDLLRRMNGKADR